MDAGQVGMLRERVFRPQPEQIIDRRLRDRLPGNLSKICASSSIAAQPRPELRDARVSFNRNFPAPRLLDDVQ